MTRDQKTKFIELADAYVTVAIEAGLPETHNAISGNSADAEIYDKTMDYINIYLANKGETWAVTFHDKPINGRKIEVCGYSKCLNYCWEYTEEEIGEVYRKAKEYFDNFFIKKTDSIKISTLKEKHKKIKDLERELRKLKGLV